VAFANARTVYTFLVIVMSLILDLRRRHVKHKAQASASNAHQPGACGGACLCLCPQGCDNPCTAALSSGATRCCGALEGLRRRILRRASPGRTPAGAATHASLGVEMMAVGRGPGDRRFDSSNPIFTATVVV
jgi:hypothetical protein